MSTRTTIRSVNAALTQRGHDVELVRGRGYFYFQGPDAENMFEQGVYAAHLGTFTVEGWCDQFETMKQGD